MGLHDRLKTSNGGSALTPAEALLSGGSALEAAHTSPAKQDPYAELKTRIHRACIATLGAELFRGEGPGDLTERVPRAVAEQLVLDRTPLTREERRQISREITADILGYGPLEPFLRDDSVTEVMVNAHDRIYVERLGKIERTPAAFADNSHLLRIIDKIVSQVGRRVDEASPMVDARLPDGSRVNAIIPPLALRGPTLTIRKFSRDPYTMNDLISFGSISPKAAQFLASCAKGTLNILISWGTRTGGTPATQATAPGTALRRREPLVLPAGRELPLPAIPEQLSSAFDLLIQITRLVDGSRRISHATEVLRMESDVITLQDIFIAKPPDEESASTGVGVRLLSPLSCSGLKPNFLEKMAANGVMLQPSFFTKDDTEAPAVGQGHQASKFKGAFQ